MIPIIWRYLLSHYLKVLALCVVSFIAVLLTTRLQEIAHFAALGAQSLYILWFAIYQIPYILPIAVPIACLISAMILVQHLSATSELTALRASGIALKSILTPILMAAVCLSLFNFYIISEVATRSHLKTRALEQELRSINPLLLLENRHLSKIKGIYVNSLGESAHGGGESAADIVIAIPNKKNNRLSVMLAKSIQTASAKVIGQQVTLVNSLGSLQRNEFDHLLIENMKNNTTSVQDFSHLLKKQSTGRINADYLNLSLLILRTQEDFIELKQAEKVPEGTEKLKFYQRRTMRNLSEFLRRFSLSLAAFTFTLLGVSFGISISRKSGYQGLMWVLSLASLYLIFYFTAKSIDHLFLAATLLYLTPHLAIIAFSVRNLQRISKGIE